MYHFIGLYNCIKASLILTFLGNSLITALLLFLTACGSGSSGDGNFVENGMQSSDDGSPREEGSGNQGDRNDVSDIALSDRFLSALVAREKTAEGVMLEGVDTASAIESLGAFSPFPTAEEDIDNSTILNQITAVIAPGATVSSFNQFLLENSARVIDSLPQSSLVVLKIPRQIDASEVTKYANRLSGSDDILFAFPSEMPVLNQWPENVQSGLDQNKHWEAIRMQFAWNASSLATRNRNNGEQSVTVIVPDHYWAAENQNNDAQVYADNEIGSFSAGSIHGHQTSALISGNYDNLYTMGASPAPTELIDLISMPTEGGGGWKTITTDLAKYIVEYVPGKFVLSSSLGMGRDSSSEGCTTNCRGTPLEEEYVRQRVVLANMWRMASASFADRMLHLTSAGNSYVNEAPAERAQIPDLNSPFTVNKRLPEFSMVYQNYNLLPPDNIDQISSDWMFADATDYQSTLIVGASDNNGVRASFSSSATPQFPNAFSDIRAPGFQVPSSTCDSCVPINPTVNVSGTSFATPIVAGLGAYLWSLSPSKSAAEIADILVSAQDSHTQGLVDAYDAVLSLDEGLGNASVRCAILDVVLSDNQTDCQFDADDIRKIMNIVIDLPVDLDESRFDFNANNDLEVPGGGSNTAPFDLNANGIIDSEALPVNDGLYTFYFDESTLTDQDILCYYSKSSLRESSGSVEVFSHVDLGRRLVNQGGLLLESDRPNIFEITDKTHPCSEWPIFATLKRNGSDEASEYYIYAGRLGFDGKYFPAGIPISLIDNTLGLIEVNTNLYLYSSSEDGGKVDLETTLDGRRVRFEFLDVEEDEEEPNNRPVPDPGEVACCGVIPLSIYNENPSIWANSYIEGYSEVNGQTRVTLCNVVPVEQCI